MGNKDLLKPRSTLLLSVILIMELSPLLVFASFKPVEIKAAYLYNLANFVYWPELEEENGPFVIEILGNPLLAKNLVLLTQGEKLGGKPIIVKAIDSVEEIRDCQILFVDSSREKDFSEELLKKLALKHTVTVGNSMEFLQKGAMVGLVPRGSRILIAVNPGFAEQFGISFSSKLLKVALIYQKRKKHSNE